VEHNTVEQALMALEQVDVPSQLVVRFNGRRWMAELRMHGAADPHIAAEGETIALALEMLAVGIRAEWPGEFDEDDTDYTHDRILY
jgi:hypothetical protein